MDAFLAASSLAFEPQSLLALVIGSLFGLAFGCIPGLTFTMALALILPLTFTLEPMMAIAMLISTYIGGASGGTVAAILIGVPGTPSSAATVSDGHALALSGKASLAIAMATISSTLGGIFSLVVMVFSVKFLAEVALVFGPAEIFALVVFGMAMICGLAEQSLLRGLIGGVIGLMIMTIGQDPIDGVSRLTFGNVQLLQGVDLLVAMIGLFAIPQVVDALVTHRNGTAVASKAVKVELPSLRYIMSFRWNLLRSSVIGTVIGAIPGTSGTIAAFIAYAQEKRMAPNQEEWGKGEMGGVVAPETANNAVTGGAMIPMLGLGIPGDPATALILGGLLVHGIQPGPLLFIEQPETVYSIYLFFGLSYVLVTIIMLFGVKAFVQALRLPHHLLAVAIMVLCVVGSYSLRNSMFDVGAMVVVGLFGYLLQKARVPLTPILLGLVLGPTMERELRTAMIMSGDDTGILLSPIALLFFGFALLVILAQAVSMIRAQRQKPTVSA